MNSEITKGEATIYCFQPCCVLYIHECIYDLSPNHGYNSPAPLAAYMVGGNYRGGGEVGRLLVVNASGLEQHAVKVNHASNYLTVYRMKNI
jgi:hypothetical protein